MNETTTIQPPVCCSYCCECKWNGVVGSCVCFVICVGCLEANAHRIVYVMSWSWFPVRVVCIMHIWVSSKFGATFNCYDVLIIYEYRFMLVYILFVFFVVVLKCDTTIFLSYKPNRKLISIKSAFFLCVKFRVYTLCRFETER